MPILNNIPRKNSSLVSTGNPGTSIFRNNNQHPALGFEGVSYNSPFTDSAIPPLSNAHDNSTQLQLPALKSEQPGVVVALNDYVKISPIQKGKTFSTPSIGSRPVVMRTGGPSPNSSTPFHPQPKLVGTPARRTPILSTEKPNTAVAVASGGKQAAKPASIGQAHASVGSFLPGQGSGKILSNHANLDRPGSRWNTVKKGAAG